MRRMIVIKGWDHYKLNKSHFLNFISNSAILKLVFLYNFSAYLIIKIYHILRLIKFSSYFFQLLIGMKNRRLKWIKMNLSNLHVWKTKYEIFRRLDIFFGTNCKLQKMKRKEKREKKIKRNKKKYIIKRIIE